MQLPVGGIKVFLVLASRERIGINAHRCGIREGDGERVGKLRPVSREPVLVIELVYHLGGTHAVGRSLHALDGRHLLCASRSKHGAVEFKSHERCRLAVLVGRLGDEQLETAEALAGGCGACVMRTTGVE